MQTKVILKWTLLILAVLSLIAFVIIVSIEPVVQQYGNIKGGC